MKIKQTIDAKKETQGRDGAIALTERATRIRVARGKKQLDFDMKKDPPDEEELLKAVLGPTGNLRAPTLIAGKTMIVGFHREIYEDAFG